MEQTDQFFALIEAIEENNRINDATWSDWDSFVAMLDVYEVDSSQFDYLPVASAFFTVLIRDNGENLQYYKDAYQALLQGQVFSQN